MVFSKRRGSHCGSRRRGSRRNSRSHSRSASGRTDPWRSFGSPACCAICRMPRSCSRSRAGPERGRGGLRNHAGVAVEIERPLGDRAGADPLVVAAGQQRRARRRADRGRVEVLKRCPHGRARVRSACGSPRHKCRKAETDVVEQDDRMLGASGGKMGVGAPEMIDSCNVGPAVLRWEPAGRAEEPTGTMTCSVEVRRWAARPRRRTLRRRARPAGARPRLIFDLHRASESRFERRLTSASLDRFPGGSSAVWSAM